MPEQMPLVANPPRANETSAPQRMESADSGESVEVVCVIRSSSDPQGKKEVIVLDRASPEFLRQLALEHQRQESQPVAAGQGVVRQVSQQAPIHQAQQIDPRASALR
jgi:hypothetical protein